MQHDNQHSPEFTTQSAWIGLFAYLVLFLLIAIPFVHFS